MDPIILKQPIKLKKKGALETLTEQKGLAGTAARVLTSKKTTAALAATLGLMVAPVGTAAKVGSAALKVAKFAAPKTLGGAVKAALITPVAVGVLSQSKTARKYVGKAINPLENIKKGQKIGEIIEDPNKASEILGLKETSTLKEKVIAGAKVAGVAGVATALGTAGYAAYKKIKEKKSQENVLQSGEPQSIELPNPVAAAGLAAPYQITPEASALYAPSEAVSSTQGAPQSQISPPPIQNIIQIAVR
jgi:hypothetical protein